MSFYNKILKISNKAKLAAMPNVGNIPLPSKPAGEEVNEQSARESAQVTDLIKNLQNNIILFAEKSVNLKNKLNNVNYFNDFSKRKINENADFDTWISIMKGIGSSRTGKADGLFGSRTLNGIRGADVISSLFIDYFTASNISFAFANSDKELLSNCWKSNPKDQFAKKSSKDKYNLAAEILPVLEKLNQAMDIVLNSRELEDFSKEDAKDSFKINPKNSKENESQIDYYYDNGYGQYEVSVGRWTGSNQPVKITLKDVANRSAFDAWKLRNSIKSSDDNALIETIKKTVK